MRSSVSHFGAAGLALAAFTLWVLADSCLKFGGVAHLPPYQVVGIIGVAQVVMLLAYRVLRGEAVHLWPRHPGPPLLRSGLDLGNNLCVVIAVRHLPLALFYILIFLTPMVASLLAVLFLRELLEWRKGVAILAGFVGVTVAVHHRGPARPGDHVGYLACLVCVVCFSANIVWSRVMAQTEAPESLTFFSAMVMAVFGLAAVLHGARPFGMPVAAVLGASGLFGIAGSLCFFVAVKHTSAATVSAFHYSQLLTGALIGFLVWRERPTFWMIAGAVLIVLSGGYTLALSYGDRKPPDPA